MENTISADAVLDAIVGEYSPDLNTMYRIVPQWMREHPMNVESYYRLLLDLQKKVRDPDGRVSSLDSAVGWVAGTGTAVEALQAMVRIPLTAYFIQREVDAMLDKLPAEVFKTRYSV